MNLLEEYQNQQKWREWNSCLVNIPIHESDSVLDLGCSVGSVSDLLSDETSKVTGFDINEQFIEFCERNKKGNQTYICEDIQNIDFHNLDNFSGVWSSFTLSYLPNPASTLKAIYEHIDFGGWISLIDISCFISGNMSPTSKFYEQVKGFEQSSHESGNYDFDFGSKIHRLLSQAGFHIIFENSQVSDRELNFDGPASRDILRNWEARLARLNGLKREFGENYSRVAKDILSNLKSENHTKNKNLIQVVARKI
ncbi:class I SAM-dependent methyltransferase [Shewanella sp. 202IG2-18]|uniref:class I SAM-dependent methyltransferase n=1 Tax=Parashewanella hymeniacidonis TaxID=2807618 RepID=UPI001960E7AD|nr:class I SAM-dependent methyltransferase [Parashewanella hymeniacidonis]MBM7073622.1 class I SAM-dependent methyltransferase [Parashewanella hymeniacidonis]